jgi:hypothetical protein
MVLAGYFFHGGPMRDLSFQLISTLINERIVMSFMALHSMKLIYFSNTIMFTLKTRHLSFFHYKKAFIRNIKVSFAIQNKNIIIATSGTVTTAKNK